MANLAQLFSLRLTNVNDGGNRFNLKKDQVGPGRGISGSFSVDGRQEVPFTSYGGLEVCKRGFELHGDIQKNGIVVSNKVYPFQFMSSEVAQGSGATPPEQLGCILLTMFSDELHCTRGVGFYHGDFNKRRKVSEEDVIKYGRSIRVHDRNRPVIQQVVCASWQPKMENLEAVVKVYYSNV